MLHTVSPRKLRVLYSYHYDPESVVAKIAGKVPPGARVLIYVGVSEAKGAVVD
jgi:hypothetical protein